MEEQTGKEKRSRKADAPPQSATERGNRLREIVEKDALRHLELGRRVNSKASARISPEWLECVMDRPPDPKPKKWRSIYCEEARIEACFLRYSICWPICMEYPCLTIGVLGLTREEALDEGLRLGEDQGSDTLVLDDDNWPLDLLQSHVADLLGMRRPNVSVRVERMLATKRYRREGKRVYIVSNPPALTPEEREKVIQTDNFLELKVIQTDNFPPLRKEDLEFLRAIPDLEVRTDYFRRFAALEADYLSKEKVLRSEHSQARKVLREEGSILIPSVSPVSPVVEASSSSFSAAGNEVPHDDDKPLPERRESTPRPEPETPRETVRTATATARAVDPEAEQVRQTMELYVRPVDVEAAATLITECRKADPEATPDQVREVVHAKGPLAQRRGVDNPVGFLLRVVPKCFVGGAMRPPNNSPNSPPEATPGGESYGEFKQRWKREQTGDPPSFEEWLSRGPDRNTSLSE